MLFGAHERSEIGLGIERIAGTVRVAAELDESRRELARDALVDEQPGAGAARLAGRQEDARLIA